MILYDGLVMFKFIRYENERLGKMLVGRLGYMIILGVVADYVI